jgi:RNA polymerase sigma-70 factor (ECF subfamily)
MQDLPPIAGHLEQHRAVLVGHCYRMLGSSSDADDAVQETMVRAWRSYDRFDGRSSLRTWLYRIATNVCLDAIAERKARVLPTDESSPGSLGSVLDKRPNEYWIEPISDERVIPTGADPAEAVALRQSVRLAFVSALQRLPGKQRAALLLTEVLGFSAVEAADCLGLTVASLNSALQRARASLASVTDRTVELSSAQMELVDEYVAAFERYDMDRLASLLRHDAVLSMPPFTLWLQGVDSIRSWMEGPGHGCRGSRVVRASASGQPAFLQYRVNPSGGWRAWAVVVLDVTGDRVTSITSFLDVGTLFPQFGAPWITPRNAKVVRR